MKSYHVLIFTACVMACLGALCWVLPERVVLCDYTLQWPTFAEVMGEEVQEAEEIELSESIELLDSTQAVTDTTATHVVPPAPIIPTIPIDSITDSRMFLGAFYQSLTAANTRKVRIVH